MVDSENVHLALAKSQYQANQCANPQLVNLVKEFLFLTKKLWPDDNTEKPARFKTGFPQATQ